MTKRVEIVSAETRHAMTGASTRSRLRASSRRKSMQRASYLALACMLKATAAATPPAATQYIVDSGASKVNIRVYSDGVLARVGHNHVMTSRSLQGFVRAGSASSLITFDLSFPVGELIVDDPQERRAAGQDFPPNLNPAERESTRKNMLSPAVLDAGRFPIISMHSVQMSGSVPNVHFTVLVTIRDVSRETPVDAQLTLDDSHVTASGEFDLRQSDFGIDPFSIAFGALRIDDRLRISFAVVAAPPGS
jgi:hypothetical protein